MKRLTCLIIDDEPDAHIVLKNYCSRIDYLQIGGSFFNAVDAHMYLKAGHAIDFLFLDINMPEMTGFDLLGLLSPQPKIIFTTAYKEYALQSFDYNVVDYLVKPIRFDRFIKAINKVAYETVTAVRPASTLMKFEGVDGEVDITTILYAESSGNYVKLHTASKNLLTHGTMQAISKELEAYGFIRIHKQFAVPVEGISSHQPEMVRLLNGTELPIGVSYRQYVMGVLQGK